MSEKPTFDPGALDRRLWPLQAEGYDDAATPFRERVAIQQFHEEITRQDVIGPTGIPAGSGFFSVSVEDGKLFLAPGRCYVDGVLCSNARRRELPVAPDGDGVYLIYLDVWEREIRQVEDLFALGTPAVGEGFSARGRTRTVWRAESVWLGHADTDTQGSDYGPGWQPDLGPRGRLTAEAIREIAEDALYRVEIHDGGDQNTPPRVKSSSNNGRTASRLSKYRADDNVLELATTVDDFPFGQSFGRNKWVEVVEHLSLVERRTWLGTIAGASGSEVTVAWSNGDGPGESLGASHLVTVHQWDMVSEARFDQPIALPPGSGEPEVAVGFTEGAYQAGDYWLIPALKGRNDILWPAANEAGVEDLARAPDNTPHRYCPLTLAVRQDGMWAELRGGVLLEFDTATALTQTTSGLTQTTTGLTQKTSRLDETAVRRTGDDRVAGSLELGADLNVTGNVGIGTTSPEDKLDINGDIRLRGGDIKDAGGRARVRITDNGGLYLKKADGTSVLTVDATGNVGIGTINPENNKLKVQGTTEITNDLRVNGITTTQTLSVDAEDRSSHPNMDGAIYRKGGQVYITVDDNLYIRDRGGSGNNVKMHFNTNSGALRVYGSIWAKPGDEDTLYRLDKREQGGYGWTLWSDKALKRNVKTVKRSLDKLKALRGVIFQWNERGLALKTQQVEQTMRATSDTQEDNEKVWEAVKQRIRKENAGTFRGFVAQEVEAVFPEWVKEDENGYKTINASEMLPVMIEAIKEQQQLIEKLSARLDALESQ